MNVRVGMDPEHPGWARIVVDDTGVGIAPEDLPHIFDRFYRVRNAQTNKIEGLGLGLSFVSWIVSAHGGDLHVESTPGKGSRFEIRLPATTPAYVPCERGTSDRIGFVLDFSWDVAGGTRLDSPKQRARAKEPDGINQRAWPRSLPAAAQHPLVPCPA